MAESSSSPGGVACLFSSSTYIRHQDIAESSSSPGEMTLPTAHTLDVEPPAALAVLQTVDDRRFNSLAEVTEHLKSLEPEDRYRVVNAQAERLIEIQETSDACMSYLNEYAKEDGAFSRRMDQDPGTWKKVEEAATRHRAQRNRKLESQKKVFETWGEEEVRSHFAHVFDMGETTWSKLRRVATLYPDLKAAILRIRGASLWRIQHPAIGRDAKSLLPTGADFDAAARQPEKVAGAAALATSGFGVNEHGWLVPAGRILRISEQDEQEEGSSSDLSEMPEGLEEELEHLMQLEHLMHRGGAIEQGRSAAVEQGRSADVKGSERCLFTPNYVAPAGESEPAVGAAEEEGDEEEEDEEVEDEEVEEGEEDEEEGEEGGEVEDEEEGGPPARKKRKRGEGSDDGRPKTHQCGCANEVPSSFIRKCTTKRVVHPVRQIKLVKEWLQHVDANRKVCHRHGKSVASILGMQTRTLDGTRLEERLRAYHAAALSSAIGDLKVGKDTFAWFRMQNRPVRASDKLGPYKWAPLAEEPVILTEQDQVRLCHELGINRTKWDEEGSVVVDCFDWWSRLEYAGDETTLRGMTIMKVVLEEFDMYAAHLRLINQKPNYGWLRNMYHSLGQQVMRQDPMYFAIYCALRPDQNTNLVSYPYYAKYATEGDRTFFRHIDINIGDLVKSGRGANMIQGTASLDNERDDDCTVILPGMHKHLEEWARVLSERGSSTDSFVHRILDKMFTADDAQHFNTQWTSQPCRAGQVRVTLPHIPHGALGPAKGIRRTMLPWYCGLQKDMETLEVVESGTWSDLAAAHRDLVAAPLSPSGLANRYGAIPFAFPAAIELAGLGAVSDALVCRRRHDKPAVVGEKRILLLGSAGERDQYLAKWRQRAVNQVCEAFQWVKQAEVSRFGERSFFYRVERGLSPAMSDDEDPDPAGDDEAAVHGFEGPETEDE